MWPKSPALHPNSTWKSIMWTHIWTSHLWEHSGCGSKAESGNRLFLWLVDGFNPDVGCLEHSECCGLCSHRVNPNRGVGAETQVTQNSVSGMRQQHMGKKSVRMEQSIHCFLSVTHCSFGTLQAGSHMFVSFSIVEFFPPVKVIQMSSKQLKSFSESTAFCGYMF